MAKWYKSLFNDLQQNENYLNFSNNNDNNNTVINSLTMTTMIDTTTITINNISECKNVTTTYAYDFETPIDFGPKRDSLKIVIPVTIIYGLIFITGVIGNISTCIVIKKNRSMHTATNYYLFSLAISDFLLLISGVPQEVYLTWSKYPYVFGEYFCVGRGLLAETSANATVLTITAFTVERYVAICHPFFGHAISKLSRAIRIIVLIWIVSIITATPQALQFGLVSHMGIEKCILVRIIIDHSFQMSTYIFFFVPMSIIFVLYLLIGVNLYRANVIGGDCSNGTQDGKNLQRYRSDLPAGLNNSQNSQIRRGRLGMKSTQSDTILYRYSGGTQVSAVRGRINQFGTKRVLKMLVAVVICFFLCWAPFHAQRLIAFYGMSAVVTGVDEETAITTNTSSTSDGIETIEQQTPATVSLRAAKDIVNNGFSKEEQHEIVYNILTYVSGVLYYLSTCINPLLYNLMSNKFRQAFKSILFGKKSSTARRSQNSQRSISRKPTPNSSSVNRGSSESEMQSKLSLLQTIAQERKQNPRINP